MKKKTSFTIVIALILTLGGIGQNGCKPAADNSSTRETVRWGGPRNISMLPLLAEQQGLFQKERLDASYIDIQTGKKALDALRTGDVQLGVLVDSNVAFAGFEDADDIRVLACIELKTDDALLVASPEITGVGDLAGKTIGVTLGTTSHVYVVHYLAAHGMKPEAVTLQNMPPPAIQAGLLNGTLKAGCLWQPFRYNVVTAKPNQFAEWKDPAVYTSQVLLVCTKRYFEAQMSTEDNVLVRFLRSLISAEEYAAKNQDAAIATLGEKLPLPLDVMKATWPEYRLHVFLNRQLLELLQTEGRWISESVPEHKGKAMPDYRRFLVEKPLSSVAPERVQGL
jgi:ABC-type nitrate/sulfonate/bicarbonate transport system substrate-binding protein